MADDEQTCDLCGSSGDELEYLISCLDCESSPSSPDPSSATTPKLNLCKKCCKNHLQSYPSHSTKMIILCEECDEFNISACLYCPSCGQSLCAKCDQKIHNKSKRAKHRRQQFNLQRDIIIHELVVIDEAMAEIINGSKAAYEQFESDTQNAQMVAVLRDSMESVITFDLPNERLLWEQYPVLQQQQQPGEQQLNEQFLTAVKFMPQLSTIVIRFQFDSSDQATQLKQALANVFPDINVVIVNTGRASDHQDQDQEDTQQQQQQQFIAGIPQITSSQQQQYIQLQQSSSSPYQSGLSPKQLHSKQPQKSSVLQLQNSSNNNSQTQGNGTIFSSIHPHILNSKSTQNQQQHHSQVQFDSTTPGLLIDPHKHKTSPEDTNTHKHSQNTSAAQDDCIGHDSQNGSTANSKKHGNKSLNAFLNPNFSAQIDKKAAATLKNNQSFDNGFQIYSSSSGSHSHEGNPNNNNNNNNQDSHNISDNNNNNNNNNAILNQNSKLPASVIPPVIISELSLNPPPSLKQDSMNNNINGSRQNSSPSGCLKHTHQKLTSNNCSSSTYRKLSLHVSSGNNTNPHLDLAHINNSSNSNNLNNNHLIVGSQTTNNIHNNNIHTGNSNNNNNNNNLGIESTGNANFQGNNNNNNNNGQFPNNNNILGVNFSRDSMENNNNNLMDNIIPPELSQQFQVSKQPPSNSSAKRHHQTKHLKTSSKGSSNHNNNCRLSRKSSNNPNNTSRLSRNTSNDSLRGLNTSKGSLDCCTSNILSSSLNLQSQPPICSSSTTAALITEMKSKTSHHNTYTCGMPFQQFQNPKTASLKNQQISIGIQKQLAFLAEKGELMIYKEVFLKMIQNNIPSCSDKESIEILAEAETCGIIHQTTRVFANNCELFFVSLKLEYISLQSLIWIIQSIKLDAMTPTDKLILSRIKECFGLKLTPKSWDMILNHLTHPSYIHSYSTGTHTLDLPQLVVFKVSDPLTDGVESTVIYIKDQEWIPEDQGKVNESDPTWRIFKEFLDAYFKMPILDDPTLVDSSGFKKSSYFTTIIPKSNQKKQNSPSILPNNNPGNAATTAASGHPPSREEPQELRAIPGGRYGCVQYVKYCGPNELKALSLGRLSLFVQEAINQGIIRYHRTLLVKHQQTEESSVLNESSSVFSTENSVHLEKSTYVLQRDVTVRHLQDALFDVLQENPKGISLVQIPQHLKKRVFFQFNLQDLGFPKLKNFIQTMADRVQIELAGTNNSFAVLKQSFMKISQGSNSNNTGIAVTTAQQNITKEQQQISSNSKILINLEAQSPNQSKSNNIINGQSPIHQQQQLPQTQQQHHQPSSHPQYHESLQSKQQSNFPTISSSQQLLQQQSDYFKTKLYIQQESQEKINQLHKKVLTNISMILQQSPQGIAIQNLYSTLNKQMGANFEFKLFGCMDFLGFLTSFAEAIIDIECKQNTYLIYEKNHRFGIEGNNSNNNRNNNNSKPSQSLKNINGQQNQSQQQQQYLNYHPTPQQLMQMGNIHQQQHPPPPNQMNSFGPSFLAELSQQQKGEFFNHAVGQIQKKRSMAISQSASSILHNNNTNINTNNTNNQDKTINTTSNATNPNKANNNNNTNNKHIMPPFPFAHLMLHQSQQLHHSPHSSQQFQQHQHQQQQQQQNYLESQLAYQQYQMMADLPQHGRSFSQHSSSNNNNKQSSNTSSSNNSQHNSNSNAQIKCHPSFTNNPPYFQMQQQQLQQYQQQQFVNSHKLQQQQSFFQSLSHSQNNNHNNNNTNQPNNTNNISHQMTYFTPFSYSVDASILNSQTKQQQQQHAFLQQQQHHQSVTHSRNPSKTRQRGEHSSMDIKDNIGLIEEILADTDDNYSFRTQTDRTFALDDHITSFNWSISMVNPYLQNERQREISAEFEQFPCDLSKITSYKGTTTTTTTNTPAGAVAAAGTTNNNNINCSQQINMSNQVSSLRSSGGVLQPQPPLIYPNVLSQGQSPQQQQSQQQQQSLHNSKSTSQLFPSYSNFLVNQQP